MTLLPEDPCFILISPSMVTGNTRRARFTMSLGNELTQGGGFISEHVPFRRTKAVFSTKQYPYPFHLKSTLKQVNAEAVVARSLHRENHFSNMLILTYIM